MTPLSDLFRAPELQELLAAPGPDSCPDCCQYLEECECGEEDDLEG